MVPGDRERAHNTYIVLALDCMLKCKRLNISFCMKWSNGLSTSIEENWKPVKQITNIYLIKFACRT